MRASIIIPAHNEEGLIGSTVQAMLSGIPADSLEVLVVANGCSDATAERASLAGARVVNVASASKTAALNAGDELARYWPRIYVDADVRVSGQALLALADALGAGDVPRVGAPTFHVDTSASSRWVQAYFRVWELSEFRTAGHVGSGIYGLSKAGRERFALFPPYVADDRFVQQLFRADERIILSDHGFSVRAPRTLRSEVHRAVRVTLGNWQLPIETQSATTTPAWRRYALLVSRVAPRPHLYPAFIVYMATFAIIRLKAKYARFRRQPVSWNRDNTTR